MQKQQQQGVNIATNIQVQKTLELNEKLLVEWRKLQNAERTLIVLSFRRLMR